MLVCFQSKGFYCNFFLLMNKFVQHKCPLSFIWRSICKLAYVIHFEQMIIQDSFSRRSLMKYLVRYNSNFLKDTDVLNLKDSY